MSVKVSSWVWHDAPQDINGNELILLLALADVADDNGRCRYVDDEAGLTYDGLAAKVRVDRRTIERLIPKLRARGLVTHVRGAKGRPNEFSIVVPWAHRSADNLSENRSDSPTTVQDSPTTVQDSPTTDPGFPDNSDVRTSLIRTNVRDVATSGVESKPVTLGQRFAQPLVDVLTAELDANEVRYSVGKAWLDAARLLVDRDGRDPREARALIEWACRDSFWRSNILSMATFRKQYDKLRLSRERAGSRPSTLDHGREVHEILAAREQGGQLAVTA